MPAVCLSLRISVAPSSVMVPEKRRLKDSGERGRIPLSCFGTAAVSLIRVNVSELAPVALAEVPAIALGPGVVVAEIRCWLCQPVDCTRHHAVDFGLSIGFGLLVAIAVDLQRVSVVLQAGAQEPGEV